jgi:hypothetical protein
MKLFRIVRNEYYNEYGQLARTYWTVLEKRKFLWWYYWKTVEHQADWDYTSPITFKSNEDANEFVQEVFVLGKPYSQFVEIIEEEFAMST